MRRREERNVEQHLEDLRSGSVRRRLSALTALTKAGDARADDAMLDALRDPFLGIRLVALKLLVDGDRNRDIRPIMEGLRHGGPEAEWRPPSAREIINFGLVYLTQANAIEVLGDALVQSEDDQLRHEAAIHLGKLVSRRAVPAFVQALSDHHDPVRREAARGLGAIGDPQAIPALLRALDDPYPAVRRARRALVKSGAGIRDVRRFHPATAAGQQARRKLLRRLLLGKLMFLRR